MITVMHFIKTKNQKLLLQKSYGIPKQLIVLANNPKGEARLTELLEKSGVEIDECTMKPQKTSAKRKATTNLTMGVYDSAGTFEVDIKSIKIMNPAAAMNFALHEDLLRTAILLTAESDDEDDDEKGSDEEDSDEEDSDDEDSDEEDIDEEHKGKKDDAAHEKFEKFVKATVIPYSVFNIKGDQEPTVTETVTCSLTQIKNHHEDVGRGIDHHMMTAIKPYDDGTVEVMQFIVVTMQDEGNSWHQPGLKHSRNDVYRMKTIEEGCMMWLMPPADTTKLKHQKMKASAYAMDTSRQNWKPSAWKEFCCDHKVAFTINTRTEFLFFTNHLWAKLILNDLAMKVYSNDATVKEYLIGVARTVGYGSSTLLSLIDDSKSKFATVLKTLKKNVHSSTTGSVSTTTLIKRLFGTWNAESGEVSESEMINNAEFFANVVGSTHVSANGQEQLIGAYLDDDVQVFSHDKDIGAKFENVKRARVDKQQSRLRDGNALMDFVHLAKMVAGMNMLPSIADDSVDAEARVIDFPPVPLQLKVIEELDDAFLDNMLTADDQETNEVTPPGGERAEDSGDEDVDDEDDEDDDDEDEDDEDAVDFENNDDEDVGGMGSD